MKQETTITDYHNMYKKPVKKYHALQIRDTVTGRKKWAVVWFTGNGEMYRQFTRAKSRESAIVALKIEAGLLIQGLKKANLATIKKQAMDGFLTSSALHDSLVDLYYYD